LSCHRAKRKANQQKPKQKHQTKTPKTQNPQQKTNKTRHKHGTVGDQLVSSSELKRIRKDDNIVSPKGLVWQKK
jgi:hypothetical protein